MCESTKKFFCMFALAHVLRQAGRGRLLPGEFVGRLRAVAHRQRGVEIQVAAFLIRSINSSGVISQQRLRAFLALRMSRCSKPPLAWLTSAIGSPVMKWTTWSFSSDRTAFPSAGQDIQHAISPIEDDPLDELYSAHR